MPNDPLLDQFNRMMPLFEQATGEDWFQYDQRLSDLLAQYEEEDDPDELAWIRVNLEDLVGEMAPDLWEWTENARGIWVPNQGLSEPESSISSPPVDEVVRDFVRGFLRPEEAAIGGDISFAMGEEMAASAESAVEVADDTPPTVTRFTDITCPRQVWVETPRIPVTVRLTLAPVEESAATAEMVLRTDLPVSVTIDAFGFDVLEAHTIDLPVPPDQDSARITFMLKPRVPGPGRVILEFRQAGNLAGAVSLDVVISAQPVQEIPAQHRGLPLTFEEDAPMPDRTLMIGYGWADGQHQLTFRLFEGDALREAFPPKRLATDVEVYVADLYGQLTHHADEATDHRDPAKQAEAERLIRQIGRKLWRDILPQPLQAIYLAEWQSWQDSSLLIVSDEPHLPWELIWPFERGWAGPDQPWCLSMGLARWLRAQENGRDMPGLPTRLHWQRFSTIVPSDARLIFAQEELGLLRQVMANNGMDDRSPAHFALADVLALFTTGEYDWIHAATHGSFRGGDPGRRSTLSLSGRETLSPDDLLDPEIEEHLWQNRPGIVFNTCDSGRNGWGLSGAGGWAGQLVGSGASLFLAAQWSVTDKQALKFAQQFYKTLGDGESVAQAVRTARHAAKKDGDPTWLAYSLYAHPSAVVG